jgi:hypothetical protein
MYSVKNELDAWRNIMCGRYTMFTEAEALAERFHAQLSPDVAGQTYNSRSWII